MVGRISRLEKTVSALVQKLGDQSLADISSTSPANPPPIVPSLSRSNTLEVPSAAPVFLIRDVVSQVGLQQHQSPVQSRAAGPLDIIGQGLLNVTEVTILIELSVLNTA